MPAEMPPRPRALLRPAILFALYRRRLRVHAIPELAAGFGVAVAVALVFAVTVANSSILGAASEVVRKVAGPASLQLRARNDDGVAQGLVRRVKRLAGVEQAAPILEQTATIRAADGRSAVVELAGANVDLTLLDGLASSLPIAALSPGSLALSHTVAGELGITGPGAQQGPVSVLVRGRRFAMKVSSVLGSETAGPLSHALLAVLPLEALQRLSGLPGAVTRILVEPEPGRKGVVRSELETLAGGRLAVSSTDHDLTLLREALKPSDQASEFFAAISALLGFLLAFNAILLTVPERRQMIASLRIQRVRRSAIAQIVIVQALALGFLASAAGLLGGYLLSRYVFDQSAPGYLAQAFALGSNVVYGLRPFLLAGIGGVLITIVCSCLPLLDLRRRHALDAVFGHKEAPAGIVSETTRGGMFLAAVVLFVVASVLFLMLPRLALAACVLLALAMVLVVPTALMGVLSLGGVLARRAERFTVMPVALAALRGTGLRSLGLMTTGAIAIFGAVALGGARSDLLRGLRGFAQANVADGQVWVLNPAYTPETTTFAQAGYASRIARVPGVLAVRSFQSEFMDLPRRRVVILARPPGTGAALLRTQLLSGSAATVLKRLSAGGWVVVSAQIAREQHIGLGQNLVLPTPTGQARFRLAGTITNLGWPGGAVILSTNDYRARWATSDPSALVVSLAPGSNVLVARRAIAGAIGAGSGLEAITAGAWVSRFDRLADEGLSRLSETSLLLVLAAILALAATLGSHVWQQRPALASLAVARASPRRLLWLLFVESLLLLGTGGFLGLLSGVYGQLIIDGYLKQVTGFPVASLAVGWRPLAILAIALGSAVTLMSGPALAAARVSPVLALARDD